VFVGNVNTATIDIGDIKALDGSIASSVVLLFMKYKSNIEYKLKSQIMSLRIKM